MHWLTRVTEAVIIIMFIVLICIVSAEVFCRYVIGYSIFFASELSRYILVWIVFFASSLAIRAGAHVGVEFFQTRLPPEFRKIVFYVCCALVFLFLLIIGVVSVVFLIPPLWTQVTAAMGIRLFWIFLCIPIGVFLMIMQLIDYVLKQPQGAKNAQ
jgi:C4-dicarboxylate transporter DctQ subunit